MAETSTQWFKVAELDELSEGRVMSVTAGTRSLALVHFDGQYAAMDNHCPHQGGPLGEGSIEKGGVAAQWRCTEGDQHDGAKCEGGNDGGDWNSESN